MNDRYWRSFQLHQTKPIYFTCIVTTRGHFPTFVPLQSSPFARETPHPLKGPRPSVGYDGIYKGRQDPPECVSSRCGRETSKEPHGRPMFPRSTNTVTIFQRHEGNPFTRVHTSWVQDSCLNLFFQLNLFEWIVPISPLFLPYTSKPK